MCLCAYVVKKINNVYLLGLVAIFSIHIAQAKPFFVSNEAEFNASLSIVKAGDEIIWRNGTYQDMSIKFHPKNNGTNEAPIIFKAETAGKVIFTGSSFINVDGSYLKAEGFLFQGASTLTKQDVLGFSSTANHSRITNCAVIDYSPTDAMQNNNWISMQGTHNELDHCSFKGKTNQGPYLVVRYLTDKTYVEGSETAPSTYFHIHHNYFGYRTLPSDNGGEDMRIGDSHTSFTKGFNIIEYNYFEDHRLEAEVISNKSCDNIYRFNSFINNDGQMVLRHGRRCFVYGNYFDGTTGRGTSGGIRIINPNQTVFNNYITNADGSEKSSMKAAIVVMCGYENSPLNGYYPADSAIIAFNTIVNCLAPIYKMGLENKSKGKPPVIPKALTVNNNVAINNQGKIDKLVQEIAPVEYALCEKNYFTNGSAGNVKGFEKIKESSLSKKDGYYDISQMNNLNKDIIKKINDRLTLHNIVLTSKEITSFSAKWVVAKKDVGVNYMWDVK